jgi:Angiotensin-converting enzyme
MIRDASRQARQMEAPTILEYFAPLRGWLKEQNQGRLRGC